MGADTIEGVILRSEHRHLVTTLSVLISIVTIGHELWLFILHSRIIHEVIPAPRMMQVIPPAIPTFIPIATFPCSIVAMFCCMACFGSIAGMSGLVSGIHTTVSVMLTAMYPVQVTIYMWTHVHLYLLTYANTITEPTTQMMYTPCCVCTQNGHNNSDSPLEDMCVCALHYTQRANTKLIYFERGIDNNQSCASLTSAMASAINGSSAAFTNQSEAQLTHTTDDTSIRMLLIGLQTSVIIMVLRMPLFILWNDIEFTREGSDARNDLCRKVRGKRTSQITVDKESISHDAETDVDDPEQKDGLSLERKLRLRMMIDLTCYGLLEGVDAFSLVEVFFTYSEFYALRPGFTNILLVCVSISILTINYSNMVVTIPKQMCAQRRICRLIVILIGNLPLLIFRCCVLSFHGGLQSMCLGCTEVLFILKEIMMLILGITEFMVGKYILEEVKKHRNSLKSQQPAVSQQSSPTNDFLGASFKLANSFTSNSAMKYRVKEPSPKRRGSKMNSSSVGSFDIKGQDGKTQIEETSTEFNIKQIE